MTNVTDFVVKSNNKFYVDLQDMDTGESVCNIGDTVTFMVKGKRKVALVMNALFGRDDDIALLQVIEQ